MVHDVHLSNFTLANFLYAPSYVSFEAALCQYGILSQFPKEVTSATVKLPRQKEFEGVAYGYYHIQKNLFWGYRKQEGYLIAEPEKALLDQAYLAAKGLKAWHSDEYTLISVDTQKLHTYAQRVPIPVQKLIKHLSYD